MTKVTLSFNLESLYPRPELMPPNGREIILSYLKRELRQYQAEELLGWTRTQFNDYLASIVTVSDRKLEETSADRTQKTAKKSESSNFIKEWEKVIKRLPIGDEGAFLTGDNLGL